MKNEYSFLLFGSVAVKMKTDETKEEPDLLHKSRIVEPCYFINKDFVIVKKE